ncbi:MAG: tandem-95 repeat protein, partial [Magnetospirillum sp.]
LAGGGALPTWLSIDPVSGVISGTPTNGEVGDLSLRVTATDVAGATASATFDLHVANTNDAPVLVGPVGAGASFAGTTESYLQASTLTGLGTGDAVTIEFWASFQSSTHSTALSYVAPDGKTFSVYAEANSLGIRFDGQTVPLTAMPNRSPGIVAGEWTHVAVSFDTSGRLELLKNGEVVAFATGLTLDGYAASGGTLVLGQDQTLAGGGFVNTHAMLGALDSVRVWNTARSAADVRDGMDGTFSSGTTGLVASYSLDDVSGDTVANGVGGTNTLVRFGELGQAGLVTRIEDQGPYTTVLHGIDVDVGDTLTYSLTAGGGTDGTTTLTSDGSLTFTPDANFNGTHTVSVQVSDNHGGTYSRDFDIVVTAANDAPTLDIANQVLSLSGTTAAPIVISDADLLANFSDLDGDALRVQSITATNGTVTGDGSGHWLVTPPTAGGTITLSYVVADGHGGTVTGTATVAATFVNHAPVLDISATPTLTVITEDFVPAGGGVDTSGATMVSSLLAARTSDVDGTVTPRMAVVDADTTHGAWFYSTDAGTTWSAMGAVSETSARLLGDSNSLRFVPMGDWNGTATISYRAVDASCTDGNGSLVDASDNGGGTAFSAAAETASISVTAVDDTPVALGPPGDAASGEGAAIAVTGLSVHEVDGQTVQVMLSGAGGALTLGSTTGVTFTTGDGVGDAFMTFTGSVDKVNAALATLTYAPTAGFVGAHTVTMQVGDYLNGTVNGTSTTNVSVEVIAPLEVMGAASRVDQLRLDGSDYASAAVPLSSEAGTVELWLQKGQWNLATTDEMIIGNNIKHDVTGAVYLSDNASYGLNFRYGGAGADAGNNAITYNGSDGWTAGSWHHLAISWERTGGLTTLKLYADGTMVGTATTSLQIPADKLAEWVIGKELDPTSVNQDSLQGSVTDVRLWTTARSPSEIADAMHTRLDGTETGLAANWTFEGGATGGPGGIDFVDAVADNFDSNTLDTDKWTVVSGNISGHTLSVSGGHVVSTDRELLRTAEQFTPTTDHPVTVSGTWTPVSDGESLTIVTRGDAATLDSYSRPASGLSMYVASYGAVAFEGLGDAASTLGTTTGDSSLTVTTGHSYAFTTTDNGNTVTFTIRDLADSANAASITSTSSYVGTANHVFLFGSEYYGGMDRTSYFDDLSVEQGGVIVPVSPPAAATRFDGDDALATAAPVTTATDNVTLEAWVNWDGTNTATAKLILYNGDGSNSGYGLGVHDDGALFLLAGGVVAQDIGYSLRSNEWSHLAAVRDNGTWKIYVGDEVVYTTTGAVPNGFGSYPGTTLIGQAFTGEIADARIWSVARSGAEIAETRDGGLIGSETGLEGWWPLADGTGLNLKSGGTTATASGTPVATETGPALFDDILVTSEDRSILGKLGDTSDAATTYTVQDAPDHGTLTLNADGSFLYKPTIGYAGSDSFTVHVVDGVHTPVDKTISISVEDTTRFLGTQVAGSPTAGVHLDGNSAVATTAVVTAATANVTLEVWAKVDEIPLSTSRTIFGNGTQSSSGYCIQVDSTGHIGLSVWGVQDIFSTTVVNPGEWHHYAAVLGSGNAWTLYMDGQPILSTTAAAANVPNGATTVGNTGGVGFTGEVAEARIWTVARTQADIIAGMNTVAVGNEADLAGHWSLDGTLAGGTLASPVTLTAYGTPTFFSNEPAVAEATSLSTGEDGVIHGTLVAADSDGAAVTFGTITNGATAQGGQVTVAADGTFTYQAPTGYAGADSFTIAANDGSAYSTTGTIGVNVVDDTRVLGAMGAGGRFHSVGDSLVALGNAASLATAAGSFTWETWVRSTATAKRQDLIDVHGINTSFNRLYIGADNKLHFENEANAGPTSTATVADGGWHHVSAVYDATAGSVQLLVDGVASGAPVSMPVTVGVNANDNAATLGGLNDQGVYSNMLVGELDNTRIWGTARSANQITATMHGQPAASEPGLLGSWTFNEGDGAVDHAGGDNSGRIWTRAPSHLDDTVLHLIGNGAVTVDPTGMTNTSVNPGDGPFTWEAWVRTTAATGNILFIGNGTAGQSAYLSLDAGKAAFSTGGTQAVSTSLINDGTWHHVAVSVAGDGTAAVYVDGAQEGSYGVGAFAIAEDYGWIGYGGSGSTRFAGDIADVRVWRGVRSTSDIVDNMNHDPAIAFGGSGTLVGYWTLDEGSGATVLDSAPDANDNSGAISGGAWVDKDTSSGIVDPPDTAMHFNGSSYVDLGDVNDLGTGDFTIETWINPDTLTGNQIIMLKGQSGDATGAIALFMNGSQFGFDGGGLWDATNGNHLISSAGAVKVGEWQHVAVTRQGSGYSLYLDGVLIDSAIGTADYNFSNAHPMRIGSHNSGGAGVNYFNGDMADFRIWNTALNDDQLWTTMTEPASGHESGLIGNWKLDGNLIDSVATGGHNGTVVGTATYVATGPQIADTTIETGQNVPYHGSLLAADEGGDAITWGTITNGDTAHGTITVAADGSFTYTPDAGFTGSDSFAVAANDASSHDTTATITVNVEQTVFAGVQDAGGRLRFDGVNDYATAVVPMSKQAGTIELWLRQADWTPSVEQYVIGNGVAHDVADAVYLSNDDTDGLKFRFGGESQLGNLALTWVGSAAWTAGSWHQIAATWENTGAGTQVTLYADGIKVATGSSTANITAEMFGNWALGKQVGTASDQQWLNGSVDDVRLWMVARSGEEIAAASDQALSGSETGLAANWTFDGDASWGGHVEDRSTANHDLILAGGSAAPKLIDPPNLAASFDTSSHLEVSAAPVLTATNNFTMEAWAKADSLAAGRVILRNGDSSTDGYALVIDNGVPEIVLGGVGTMSATAITVGADEWHHYAVTRSNGSWSLYVDGVKAVLTNSSLVPLAPTTVTRIGDSWDGEIADVRLWTTARSQADIQTFMPERLSGIEPNLAGYWRLDNGTADSSIISPHNMAATGTVTYVATGPDIHTLSIETNEDTVYRGLLDGHDANGALTWGTITNGATSHGTVTVSADGSFAYTPTAGFHGSDSFTVTNSASVSQTVGVTVWDSTEALGVNSIGSQLQFDGSNDYATATLAGNPLSTRATVEFWVSLQRLGTIQDLATLSDGNGHTVVVEVNAAGQLSVWASGSPIISSTTTLSTSSWSHVAVTSSETGTVLFVNGIRVDGASGGLTLLQNATQTLKLGTDAGNFTEAAFDDVRVWSDARTAEEIHDSYRRASATEADNLVGRWNFNSSSSPLNDLSGHDNTLVLGDGAYNSPSAPLVINPPGRVVTFDGTDDHMTVGALTLTGGSYTLEAWVKPTVAKDEVIFDLGRGSTSEIILRADAGGHLQLVSTADGVTGTLTSTGSVAGGQWSHVAVVNNGGAVQVYVDGAYFAMNGGTLPTPTGSVTLSDNIIGWDGDTVGDAFAGMLGDVRLWTTARSQSEIQATMNTRLQGGEAGLLANWRLDDLSSGTAIVADDNAVAGGATDATLVGFSGQTYVVSSKGSSYGQSLSVAEDTFYSGRVTAYDYVTGGTISSGYSLVGGTKTAHGSVSITADGTTTYTPDANFIGTDSFVFQVADPQGGLATSQTITVQVTADANGPTTATWGGGSGSWNNSANWTGQETPGAETAVTIAGGNADYYTAGTLHPTAASLAMTGGTLSIAGGTLDLAGNGSVGAAASLRMTGGQLSGSGSLTNSGTMSLTGGSIGMAVVNQGLAMFDATMLTLTAGWDNTTGTFEFGSGTGHSLTVSGGTFANAGTGVVHVASGSSHTVSGAFKTAGLLDVDGSLSLNHSGSTIELAGGTIDVSTANTLTIDSGTTNLTGGIAVIGGGSVTLAGNHTLDVGSGYTHTGGRFLGMGGTVTVVGSGSFTNAGTLTVDGDTNDIWSVAVANSGQLNVLGNGVFNVANGLGNTGTIELNGAAAAMTGGINVTGGTLVNQAGGLIHVGAGLGTEVISGAFKTLGRLDIDDDLTLSHNGAVIDFADGTIDVAAGSRLTIDGGTTKLDGKVTLTGDGTVDFAGIQTLDIGTGFILTAAVADLLSMSGSVTIAGTGTFTNQGRFTIDNNDDRFTAALTNAGTIDVFGGWRNGALNVDGGMVNTGLLMLEGGAGYTSTVNVGAGNTLVNQGSMVITGSGLSSISGGFDNQGSLYAASDFNLSKTAGSLTNSGTMTLAEARTLNISGGADLLNTGVITSGGTITLSGATLTNQGTLVAGGTGGLSISGGYAMSDFAELDVSVQGGTAPVATSLHMTSGTALLDGTLKVSFLNHMPTDGLVMTVVYGSHSGEFMGDDGVADTGDEIEVVGLGADWTASLDYSSPSAVTVTFHMVDKSSFDATSGSWGTAAEWLGSDVPSTAETAEIAAGKSVQVDTAAAASSITDAGTLALMAGGTLTVGTTLLVASGGVLDLSGGVLSGGTVIVEGAVSLHSGTIACGGAMEVYSAAVNLTDTTMTLDRALDLWGVTTLNDTQFSGSGTIDLFGNSTLAGFDSFAGMVINDGTMALNGATGATVGRFGGGLDNDGVIETGNISGGGGSHILDGHVINDGLIHVSGADLSFTGATLTNHGTLSVDMGHTFDVNRAGADFTSDGLLTGSGTLDLTGAAPFTNHGAISGSLTIEGDVVLGADSDLRFGAINDHLDVNGHLALGGDLDISSSGWGGGAASLVSWDSASGYFDSIGGLDQGANGVLDITFGDTGIGVTHRSAFGAMTGGNDVYQGIVSAGSPTADYVGGSGGDDTIFGNGGADVLFGGDGDDHLHITDSTFHFLDGGAGTDTLHLDGNFDFSAIRDDILQNFEVIDLTFAGNQTVTLNASDLAHMSGGTNAVTGVANSMVIIGNAGDTVNLGNDWSLANNAAPSDGNSYTQYANAATGVTVYVDNNITQNGPAIELP